MQDSVFYIVDVFAESRYAGNQLAVVRHGRSFSDTEMQAIAKEMNYSETTFIMRDEPRENGFDVRIFTPAEEIPFAGHPTLGTAFIIMQDILGRPVDTVALNLKVGRIPVAFTYKQGKADELWMTQRSPQFGLEFDIQDVAPSLGLDAQDLDERYPVMEVSTGLPFMIVPVKTLDAMKRAKVRLERFFALIERAAAKAPLLFCPETYGDANDLNVRVFVDYYNIPEDPATGSANGCLAAYLVKTGYFGGQGISVRVEQGYEIGRPSLLLLKAKAEGETIKVQVGGRVIKVAEGRLIRE